MVPERSVLLFGANGQVGHELRSALAPLGSVVALNRAVADFSRPDTLAPVVAAHRAAIVVIAAAYTAVDRAESEPDLAHRVNAAAPGVIAAAAELQGACVVYYSTDYVFDGAKSSPYVESDAPAPLSVYGRTKLAGELAVAAACRRHLILRTSWVVGAHGANFLKTMLRVASERPSLRVLDDQFGAPTSAELIAQTTTAILRGIRDAAPDDARWGTYHLTAAGAVSWNGYARHVLTRARAIGIATQAGPDDVVAIDTAGYPTPARRPANSRLNTARLRTTFGIDLPEWTVGVDRVLDQLHAA